jgi:hypothetical protein
MRIFLAVIWTLLAFFASHAQDATPVCPEISIQAPETLIWSGGLTAFARYEGASSRPDDQFDWIIVRDEGSTKIKSSAFINLKLLRSKNPETIVFIARSRDSKCDSIAVAKTTVYPNVGSPYIIDEYWPINWNDERARLDNVAQIMKDRPTAELLIFISFNVSTSGTKKRTYLLQISNYFSKKKNLPLNRITFLLSTSAEKRTTRFQPIPTEMVRIYPMNGEIAIKAEEIDSLSDFFSRNK